MTNRDNIRRLINCIVGELAAVKQVVDQQHKHDEDLRALSDLTAASIDELATFSDSAETAHEAGQVKALHDRIHVVVVQLRVMRNTFDVMEQSAERALEDVRRISSAVEQPSPDDDEL